MPVVGLDSTNDAALDGQTSSGPAPDTSSSNAGQEAMALLHRGSTDPAAYAAILHDHPGIRQGLMELLHRRFGNSFVTAVLSLTDQSKPTTAPTNASQPARDHQGAVLAQGENGGAERNPDVAARRKKNEESRAKQGGERSDEGAVGDMLDSAGERIPLGPAAEQVGRDSHREGLIQGIGKIQQAIFHNVNRSIERADSLIEPAEVPKNTDYSWLGQLLGFAASTSIYGLSAAVGAWAGAALFGGGGSGGADGSVAVKKSVGKQKFIENIVKQTIKEAFSVEGSDLKAGNIQDLKMAYKDALTRASDGVEMRFAAQWSGLHDRLAQLSDADLESAHDAAQRLVTADVSAIQEPMIDRAVVGWTNFLAQMTHGKMRHWDMWERNGSKDAAPTKDAQPAPTDAKQDPTGANIDPAMLDKKLGQTGAVAKAESGMLEVFVDVSGHLIPGHGMRLADVGPKVRERIAEMGRVGDLRVNKVIHIVGNPASSPISVDGVVVVTADGYVRDVTWPSNQQVAIDYENPVGPARVPEGIGAMRDLTGGRPSKAHRDNAKEQTNVAHIVETVQNLSLHQLKS